MYARGMTVREIQGFLAEQYGTDVSPEFISTVTDAVMTEVTAWHARPLVLTEDGPLRIEVPRDRAGSFESVLIPKHERRFTGFDDKIVAMYARGMTVREIQGFLADAED